MATGTLEVKIKKGKKKAQLSYTNSQGQFKSTLYSNIPKEQVDPALQQTIEESVRLTLKVEFEEEGNQILKLREQGQPWAEDIQKLSSLKMLEDSPQSVNLN
jgi:hypothetical protein